jgi:predicted aconitase
MRLREDEEEFLEGRHGEAARKSMEILVALGEIYGAKQLVEVSSVQVAGVSYHNLGDAGLEFLSDMAHDGRVRVPTTLNPAGMDLEDWRSLGIPEEFARKQAEVIDAYRAMGVIPCCSCSPYLIGNLPRFGEHVAWSESSAVTFANSVIGARTNREGGPSALAAAIVGKTPAYGLHLEENRAATIHVEVKARMRSATDFGALGYVVGTRAQGEVAYLSGIAHASVDDLRSLCASLPTYGGQPIVHLEDLTPVRQKKPKRTIVVRPTDLDEAIRAMSDDVRHVDFVALGCPHASIAEIADIAALLRGKRVKADLWVATARPTKLLADLRGYTAVIEQAGGRLVCDTCMAVAPLRGRFRTCATTSAKGCYYARGHNGMKTRLGTLAQCIDAAVSGTWR